MTDIDWSTRFKMEPPDTEGVYAAYLAWYDPEYGNQQAQTAWEANNRAEFDSWLAQIRKEAWDEGLQAHLDYITQRRGANIPYPRNPYSTANQRVAEGDI